MAGLFMLGWILSPQCSGAAMPSGSWKLEISDVTNHVWDATGIQELQTPLLEFTDDDVTVRFDAVDRASGAIGGFHLSEAKDRDGAVALGTVLRDTLTQLEARPGLIRVQRSRVAAMLANVARQLSIRLLPDVELSQLNSARRSMQEYFDRFR
jgi:hypothetical protein